MHLGLADYMKRNSTKNENKKIINNKKASTPPSSTSVHVRIPGRCHHFGRLGRIQTHTYREQDDYYTWPAHT
jgi:hypothetical protein